MTIKYRHYKGGIYELVCEATMEADHTPVIVYRAHDGSLWCRPKSVFFEMVEVDGKRVQRFTEISSDWISVEERLPTEADADKIGDVFFLRSGIEMAGRITSGAPVDATHWRHTCRT